jgi:hypothetical protein
VDFCFIEYSQVRIEHSHYVVAQCVFEIIHAHQLLDEYYHQQYVDKQLLMYLVHRYIMYYKLSNKHHELVELDGRAPKNKNKQFIISLEKNISFFYL